VCTAKHCQLLFINLYQGVYRKALSIAFYQPVSS
jgi:hypothetical protein